jgi:hypothetical protein
MAADDAFVGSWVYRSFHNVPEPVAALDELLLAQGELTLESAGVDLIRGQLALGSVTLAISGAVQGDERGTIRLQGTGSEGTAAAARVYDYIGYLVPSWPAGDAQRPAIVGTVIRTLPHEADLPAGATYSFVAIASDRPSEPYQLPESVTAHFADRLHRLHHALWHALRNNWENISSDKRAAIEAHGWKPPRPARQFESGTAKRPHITNGSGEDFLYFHREMVGQYRALMDVAGESPIVWVEIPQPGDPANEVPDSWPISGSPNVERRIAALKTDEFYWSQMRWWDQGFKDPTYLATLTLGALGSLLEFSVHNDMHMRWSALPRDPDSNEALPTGRPTADFSAKWDNPRYDTLLEFYSSHVNPFFWRLHPWIDDRIDDWFEAHEHQHPGAVQREQKGLVSWFKPGAWVDVSDPWVWPAMFSHGSHGSGHDIDPEERKRRIASMEEVVAILWPPAPAPLAAVLEPAAAMPEAAEEALRDLAFKLPI